MDETLQIDVRQKAQGLVYGEFALIKLNNTGEKRDNAYSAESCDYCVVATHSTP